VPQSSTCELGGVGFDLSGGWIWWFPYTVEGATCCLLLGGTGMRLIVGKKVLDGLNLVFGLLSALLNLVGELGWN
jgi:hypothetical protein